MAVEDDLRDPAIPSGEIIALEVGAIARLTPVMMAANVVNVAATTGALRATHTVTTGTALWAATVVAYSGYMLARWVGHRGRAFPPSLGTRTRGRVVLFATLLGALWAYPGLAILPTAPPQAQAFLVALCAGMVAGGAITLYPVPRAAFAYCGLIVTAHLAGFALTGEPVFWAFAVTTAMFLVVIAWGIRRHEQVFVSEFTSRRRLDARNATIERLLDETRSEAVRERREAEARLAQVQRLDAVGRLTAGVAHDFNNLLAAIMGNVELAKMRVVDREASGLLDGALDATRRGATLTQQLLAFGRKALLVPERIDPEEALTDLRDLLTRVLPATVTLRTSLEGGGRTIQVDGSQLGNALLNLVLNARDALPDGGTIEIAVAAVDVSPDHPAARGDEPVDPGPCVSITVTDDGVGVAPDVLDRVFEPFFTTKGVGEGSGLGLAMVYGFARQSGGHCAIRSGPGAGTAVELLFPASDVTARHAAHDPPVEASGGRGWGERILVVEDASNVRDVVARQLRALGFDPVIAPDGAAALGMLRGGVTVDLLLSDLVMPGAVQGPDLARRARAEGLVERVVFMSGYPEGVRRRGTERLPGVPVLQKPIRMEDLGAAIRAALDADPLPAAPRPAG